jgi:hypothetical protein
MRYRVPGLPRLRLRGDKPCSAPPRDRDLDFFTVLHRTNDFGRVLSQFSKPDRPHTVKVAHALQRANHGQLGRTSVTSRSRWFAAMLLANRETLGKSKSTPCTSRRSLRHHLLSLLRQSEVTARQARRKARGHRCHQRRREAPMAGPSYRSPKDRAADLHRRQIRRRLRRHPRTRRQRRAHGADQYLGGGFRSSLGLSELHMVHSSDAGLRRERTRGATASNLVGGSCKSVRYGSGRCSVLADDEAGRALAGYLVHCRRLPSAWRKS